MLTVSEPELIKQVLVKDFHKYQDRARVAGNTEHEVLKCNLFNATGEQWRKIRSLVSPTFTTGKMKKMQPLIKQSIDNLLSYLQQKTANGKVELDMKKVFGGLTMEVIASCAFATKTNSIADPDNPFTKNATNMLQTNAKYIIPAFIFPKFINNLIGVKSVFDHEALNYMMSLARHVINERKSAKNAKNEDFLQLLITSENTGGNYREEEDKLDAHHLNEGKTI